MEFFNILIHQDLVNAVILIFANKMDLPSARKEADIIEQFNLQDIKNHEWHIQSCCAITGEGLDEGLDWLTTKLSQKNRQRVGGGGGES